MLIVLSKEQNIIQITNMFQERGRWRKGKKKNMRKKKKIWRAQRLMQAVDSMRSEREREKETGIMSTFLLQPHHKQISRSSRPSQAINIQGISFLFKKEGRGDLDSFPPFAAQGSFLRA